MSSQHWIEHGSKCGGSAVCGAHDAPWFLSCCDSCDKNSEQMSDGCRAPAARRLGAASAFAPGAEPRLCPVLPYHLSCHALSQLSLSAFLRASRAADPSLSFFTSYRRFLCSFRSFARRAPPTRQLHTTHAPRAHPHDTSAVLPPGPQESRLHAYSFTISP